MTGPVPDNTTRPDDQVWLALHDGVSIGIDRDEAMTLDLAGFFALYKRHVYPPPAFRTRRAWKREAEAWAAEQVAARSVVARAAGNDQP